MYLSMIICIVQFTISYKLIYYALEIAQSNESKVRKIMTLARSGHGGSMLCLFMMGNSGASAFLHKQNHRHLIPISFSQWDCNVMQCKCMDKQQVYKCSM